ncbi:16S rRNA (cytidine1402-2'-O)-methyltransferase [Litorivivens lipolytica]|uniref:Ribosomal RNA small subunit methyltransferase I n=1 Tax=Litorivivens lipolytica TaxID=1524264 RepID=A0A7W4Z5G0_9GAMM|nr:16S rRNA (cytidine(1402)-2'-O)-methyltransferase [Litorivivens lipolytica]MBB3047087.1 16S rRNA (cytidine1402-2'-O)-methyltransferase [Litorivivens lipolytica]
MAVSALYIVPTPIGNRADMVPRAVEVLQSVGLIAAEDMRHSRPLLQHFAIETPMLAYHDHSDERVVERVLSTLQGGDSVALISDAGTPLISDPGYRIVDAAHSAGIPVIPIPGACAAIAALSAAGLPSDRFCFEGFLPAKSQARFTALQALVAESRTLIFYEAPHRLLETVKGMAEVFGSDRIAVLAREVTKMHETIRRAPLGELAEWIAADSNQQRGECVLLVKGAPQRQQALDAEAERILYLLMDELPLKQASQLAAKITGLKKNLLYDAGLKRSEGD